MPENDIYDIIPITKDKTNKTRQIERRVLFIIRPVKEKICGTPVITCGFPQLDQPVAIERDLLVFFHLIPEGRKAQVQQFCCVTLISIRMFECFPD